MFGEIKEDIVLKIKLFVSKTNLSIAKILTFFFSCSLIIVAVGCGYLTIMSLLSSIGIPIKRPFLILIVTILELLIIFYNLQEENTKKILSYKIKNKNFYLDLIIYGIKDIIQTFYVVFPFMLAYCVFKNLNTIYYVNCVIATLSLPLASMIMLFLIPKIRKGKLKFLYHLFNLIIKSLCILIYLIIYQILTFNNGFSVNFTIISPIINALSSYFELLINFGPVMILKPMDIKFLNFIVINFSELLIVNFDAFIATIFTSLITLFTIIILSRSIKNVKLFFSLNKLEQKVSKILKKSYIRVYNTLIKKQNFILNECLPRSPTYSLS